jgi:uncharacterized protein
MNPGEEVSVYRRRKPCTQEFRSLVRDIVANREFQRLKNFRHHDASIFHHVLRVSLIAYRIGKRLDWNVRPLTRGALLHDFYLYDWRHHDLPDLAADRNHGREHPRIALQNAEKQFQLEPLEREIIERHMWPLTLMPPRHKESFLVGCIDKQVALREFWSALFKKHQ